MYGERYKGLAPALSYYASVPYNTDRPEQAKLVLERSRNLEGFPETPVGERDVAVAQQSLARDLEAATPDSVVIEAELGRVYRWDERVGGRSVLTSAPRVTTCPRYDPRERSARQRVDDRYEREVELKPMPQQVEALLELVVGTDGRVVPMLSKVLRTSDTRANRILLQWVESCLFSPGIIDDRPVRVRIQFPITLEFVRN